MLEISEEDILEISKKLKPREKEELIKNIKQIKKKINSLDLGLAKKIVLKKDKVREILIPSLESKILQYYLKDKLKFKQYFHSYAYRKGKGSIRAMKITNEKIKDYNYALKLDIKDFFPSIDHGKLLGKMEPRFRPPVREIMKARYKEGKEVKVPEEGLPLGNPLSGTLANLFLSRFDRRVFLKCRYCFYLRYADDLIVLGDRKERLDEIKRFVEKELEGLGLELNEEKSEVVSLDGENFDFLGYNLLKNGKVLLKRETREKLKNKLNKAIFKPVIEFREKIAGVHGHTKHCQDYLGLVCQRRL